MPMIPAILLVLSAVAYRVVFGLFAQSDATWLANFAPLAAIALCSAAYFPSLYKFTLPLIALLTSDIVLNMHYGRVIARSADLRPVSGACCSWLHWSRTTAPGIPENSAAGVPGWLGDLLRRYQRVFVAQRSRL